MKNTKSFPWYIICIYLKIAEIICFEKVGKARCRKILTVNVVKLWGSTNYNWVVVGIEHIFKRWFENRTGIHILESLLKSCWCLPEAFVGVTLGFLIIPPWLIKVPGHIAILFWNFQNVVKIRTRGPNNYHQNTSNNTKTNMGTSLNILVLHLWGSGNLRMFETSETLCVHLLRYEI